MNVFAYLRVSGKGQLDGDGLDRQADGIKSFCDAKGFSILRTFTDGGVSGTVEVEDRPKFAEMLGLAGPGTATIIVVESATRLARDFIVSELCLEECRKSGLTVLDISGNDLTVADGDSTRRLIRQVLGCLAEWEKSTLVTKLRVARDRKRKLGLRCEGQKPFGHEEKTEDVETLTLILFLRDESKWSWLEIARELNRRNRPTKYGGEGGWHKGVVARIYTAEKDRQMDAFRKTDPALLAGLDY